MPNTTVLFSHGCTGITAGEPRWARNTKLSRATRLSLLIALRVPTAGLPADDPHVNGNSFFLMILSKKVMVEIGIFYLLCFLLQV